MIEDPNHHNRIVIKISQTVGLDPEVTMIAKMVVIPIKIDQADINKRATTKTLMIMEATRMGVINRIRMVVAQTEMAGATEVIIKINQGGQGLAITVRERAIWLETALSLRRSVRQEASDLIEMAQISLREGMKAGIKDLDPHIMGMKKEIIERGMNIIGLGKGILEKGIIINNIGNPHMGAIEIMKGLMEDMKIEVEEMMMEDLEDSMETEISEGEIIKEMVLMIALEVLLLAIIARKKGIWQEPVQTKRKKDHQDPLIEIIIKVETVMEETVMEETEMEEVVDLEEIMIMVVEEEDIEEIMITVEVTEAQEEDHPGIQKNLEMLAGKTLKQVVDGIKTKVLQIRLPLLKVEMVGPMKIRKIRK